MPVQLQHGRAARLLTLEEWLPPGFLLMGLLAKVTPSGHPSGFKPSTSHSRSPNKPSTGLQC
jgi:hypothetical protein